MYRSNRHTKIPPGIPLGIWQEDVQGEKHDIRGRGGEGEFTLYGMGGKGNLNKLPPNHIEASIYKGTIPFVCKLSR